MFQATKMNKIPSQDIFYKGDQDGKATDRIKSNGNNIKHS